MPWLNYVRKHKIDKEDRVVHLNEMAVYLEETSNKRIDDTMRRGCSFMESGDRHSKDQGAHQGGERRVHAQG